MPRITESAIEALALERLTALGYTYLYGPDIAPGDASGSVTPLRASFASPFLPEILEEAVNRINPTIPHAARQEAVRQVLRLCTLSNPRFLQNCFPKSSTFLMYNNNYASD